MMLHISAPYAYILSVACAKSERIYGRILFDIFFALF